MPFTAAEIAARLGGQVRGDGNTLLAGFAPADQAQPGDLTFAESEAYFALAERSAASAVLVDGDFASATKVLIRVPSARVAFATVLPLFFPEPVFAAGIHATAVVAPSAEVHPTAFVGPCCVVGERVVVGPRTVLEAQVHVGAECRLGADVRLYPNVTLYPRTELGNRVRVHAGTVIGSDGYGYVFHEGAHRKVPQVGNVIVQDDVEIGANVAVDRGALGSTVIGKGTKIDNLVQVAHNVAVGEHCLLVAQVGIAGSTRLGDHVTLAGQVGVAGHLELGARVVVAAKSGVMNHIPAGEKWGGIPARPDRQIKRQWVAVEHLPALLKRIANLEKQLAALTPTGERTPASPTPGTP